MPRGPEGWRQRLALIEAADLSWFAGDCIGLARLALWIALRLSGVQNDTAALARVGWAARRLTGGPGPEVDLAAFADRAGGWLDLMAQAADLHPISRACMGFHIWSLAGLVEHGDRTEAAATAARIAASEGRGATFAPLAMGGTGGLRAGGPASDRLARWLAGMETATLTAMLHLDDLEAWSARALRSVLTEWPLISAPMAEALTGASRAAVQRNLTWMQERGLIREVTGPWRFRMWRTTN